MYYYSGQGGREREESRTVRTQLKCDIATESGKKQLREILPLSSDHATRARRARRQLEKAAPIPNPKGCRPENPLYPLPESVSVVTGTDMDWEIYGVLLSSSPTDG